MKFKIALLPTLCLSILTGCDHHREPVIEAQHAAVLQRAKQELGKPYGWAVIGPDSYDDSGFVSYCLVGTHSRIGTEQTFLNWTVTENPLPGDVCVNNNNCGIYVSNNQMIACLDSKGVKYCSILPDMIIVDYFYGSY